MNYFLMFRVAKYEGEIAQHDHDITQKVRSISINDMSTFCTLISDFCYVDLYQVRESTVH